MEKCNYIDECLARAEKATEGPWIGDEFEMCAPKAPVVIPGNIRLVWADDYYMNEWDAEFIAQARTDVPELARRLKKAITLLRAIQERCELTNVTIFHIEETTKELEK